MSDYDNQICCISGCEKTKYANKMCEMHYRRVRNHGDPEYNGREIRRDPFDWLLNNYKIDPLTGCWLWRLGVNTFGYGVMKAGKKRFSTHRLSYEYFHKGFNKRMCVLHKCDVPRCINPDHLFLGTLKDNNLDRVRKCRGTKGESMPFAKLTDQRVIFARSSGLSTRVLAHKFNVSNETMRLAIIGKTWRHV